MKKLLIIPILFICFLSKGQAVDSASIIGKALKLGNLIVAQNDFPHQMNWGDAKKACTSLGNGWRLPTQYELEILNKNKAIISGFTNGSYWSSNDRVFLFAWQQVFLFDDQSNTGYLPSGSTGWSMKHTPNHVRAIRGPELQEELSNMSFTSIMEHLSKYLFFGFLIFVVIITIYMKMNPSAIHDPNSFLNRTLNLIKIISKNMPANVLRSRMERPMDRPALLKIDNLEIYPNDLPYPMEWNDAKKACASLGDGWRLPTKDELNILYKNRQNIGGFDIVNYWSSTEFAYMYAWKQHFFTGIRFFKRNTGRHRYSYNVRPVRTI